MRTIHRIGVGFLVGLFFAGGYAARMVSARHEMAASGIRDRGAVSAPGIPIASAKLEGGANIDLRPLETMLMVLKNLREHYVEQLTVSTEGKMTHDTVGAMLASLNDPNTRFLSPEQRKLAGEAQLGKYHGIGAVLGIKRIKSGNLNEEHLIVIAPLEGGPAAQAGLKAGDDIVAIDGRAVLPFDPYQKANEMVDEWNKRKIEQNTVRKNLKAEQERIEKGIGIIEAQDLLASDGDKPVELTLARRDSKDIKAKIDRKEFTVSPISSKLMENDAVGYVRVNSLADGTGGALKSTLADLRKREVKGLVLDLRNLAGGEADQAAAFTKPFLAGRTLAVEIKSHGRKSQIQVPSAPAEDRWTAPVVVLVNGGTARMPEVIAAALRDNLGARLVGEQTYGDFSEVTMIDERDGSAVSMTTGKFLTPKGGNYDGKGLKVDVAVASSASGDPQLKEAASLAAKAGRS